jgi:EAL and modified HD-GYP domain-containing signal transduction protein
MLAERVETREDFRNCVEAEFTYFQGYFFRRPEMLQAREIPKNRVNYLRLLQAISQTEIQLEEIDGVIKGEPSLCYRLLRYLNSAAFGFSSEIQSVKHGLSILGEREVRRWVRMVATLGAGQDKPSDLVLSAMVRARYCELLQPKVSHGQSDLFLLGLLSLMDSILEIPMGVVLEGISLDRDTRAVLLGQKSQLDLVHRLMLSQEAADWSKLSDLCTQMNLSESFVTECYWKAMQWAREMTAGA